MTFLLASNPAILGDLSKKNGMVSMSYELPVNHLAFFSFFSPVTNGFCEVEVLGSSFVKGMNSGAPGRYLRSGSGTLKP